ncbi:cobalamin biosynthesis protein CbiM, partial [archaeon]|nr:cobalamin biosynthesis protein CbiM [archaeon]
LPDYSFRTADAVAAQPGQEQDPCFGTSVSGIVGGLFTLFLAMLVGFALKKRSAGSI